MDRRLFARGTFPSFAELRRRTETVGREAVTAGAAGQLHDPPLAPRDEAVFLLTAAAEIEHALMVQYLYAAYSVHPTGQRQAELKTVKDLLTQIAREEMGHLATVENLLQLIGGPVNLGREHSPYADAVYPFRFTLEPVSLASLSKYVTAESPQKPPADMPEDDRILVTQLVADSTAANGGEEIHHVGPIFERLAVLFGSGVGALQDDDFRTDTAGHQATFDDWGFTPASARTGEALIIRSPRSPDIAALRAAAEEAVRAIGEQGEGFDLDASPRATPGESHFERFLDIYKRVRALVDQGVTVTWPLTTNPNTTSAPTNAVVDPVEAAVEEQAAAGRITELRARAWAHLFNLRYRLLLSQFGHFLRLDQELYVSAAGPKIGDRTPRGLLLLGAFDEMRHLSKIAGKLVQLPRTEDATGEHAGPTFELPYSLNLPDGEPPRWRTHLDISRAAGDLIAAELDAATDPFLGDLVASDAAARTRMEALVVGQPLPPDSLPTGFAKAVTVLEEAVRGFTIGVHENFWADRNRDDFVSTGVFGGAGPTPVALDTAGDVVADFKQSALVDRLTDADPMPRHRPPVPAPRIAFLEQWINAGCPTDSAAQIGVHHESDPAPEPPT